MEDTTEDLAALIQSCPSSLPKKHVLDEPLLVQSVYFGGDRTVCGEIHRICPKALAGDWWEPYLSPLADAKRRTLNVFDAQRDGKFQFKKFQTFFTDPLDESSLGS